MENQASKLLPLSRLVPNFFTLIGMCSGLSAIRFALDSKWEVAVAFIVFAAFIDGLDGKLARMLKADSVFGAQLDSLSDFVSFGFSPAMVLFLWQLNEIPKFGWAIALFFTICCALRLARFNTAISESPKQKEQFFTGVPAPAGAMLVLLPVVLGVHFEDFITINISYIAIYTVLVAILMSSRIPTFSLKGIEISHHMILPIMICAAAMITLMVMIPWVTFVMLSIVYYISIPVSVYMFYKNK